MYTHIAVPPIALFFSAFDSFVRFTYDLVCSFVGSVIRPFVRSVRSLQRFSVWFVRSFFVDLFATTFIGFDRSSGRLVGHSSDHFVHWLVRPIIRFVFFVSFVRSASVFFRTSVGRSVRRPYQSVRSFEQSIRFVLRV